MQESPFMDVINRLCQDDPRYSPAAYLFVREALDYTVKMLGKPDTGPTRHVSGPELLDGVRRFALEQFGPMALTVLEAWGITTTMDFGEIVFNLVKSGTLGKTEEDRKNDFANGYDFYDVFAGPFLPSSAADKTAKKRGRGDRSAKALPTKDA